MEQPILELAQTLPDLHFRYADQLLVALAPMVVTVVLHANGMGIVRRCLHRFDVSESTGRRKHPHILLIVLIVAIMLATHFAEVAAWALFFVVTGMLPDLDKAMYFSMNNYSTLGASDIVLRRGWRAMAGFEAMTAMLMFGWSTAVLAAVVQRSHAMAETTSGPLTSGFTERP